MHIVRRERRWEGGRKPYLYLRETFRQDGKPRDRVCYLGPEEAEDIESRARKVLRKRGYTDAEVREILLAVQDRVNRNKHRPILVRNRPVAWRDPPA